MAEKEISLKKIPESFVKANGIRSLADRPNQVSLFGGKGGLSAQELKAAFDKVSEEIIKRVNSMIDLLSPEINGENIRVESIATSDETMTVNELAKCIASGLFMHFVPISTEMSITGKRVVLQGELINRLTFLRKLENTLNYYTNNAPETSEALNIGYASTYESFGVLGRGECVDEDIVVPRFYVNENAPVCAINDSAFEGDTIIKSVTFSDAVKTIGSRAFLGCANLKRVRFLSSVPPTTISADSFDDVVEKIVVPKDAIEIYRTNLPSNLTHKIASEDTFEVFRQEIESLWSEIFSLKKGNAYLRSQIDVLHKRIFGAKWVSLEVKKIVSNTSISTVVYENEEFILLDIYPKTNGTVSVTYGGVTKTVTDTSGAETPTAQRVFFGTFNGVSDDVETPASGTLIISGDYSNFGVGAYNIAKNTTAYCGCITAVNDFGGIARIADHAFDSCVDLTNIVIPDSMTHIIAYAFSGCSNLESVTFDYTTGWYAMDYEAELTSTVSLVVTDPVANAAMLTDTYVNYTWFCFRI